MLQSMQRIGHDLATERLPGSSAYRQQILGLLSLHLCMSQFLVINLHLYLYPYLYLLLALFLWRTLIQCRGSRYKEDPGKTRKNEVTEETKILFTPLELSCA